MVRRLKLQRSAASGFTLIEIMIVLTLVVVLASMGLVQYRNSVTRAEEAVLKENLYRMNDAIDQYYADKNKYPSDLSALASEGYLREIPVDPMTKSKDTWVTVQSEADANNPAAQPGIYQVKSGSERTALDGTLYSDW
jgi:general secretion pathway protein G